MRDNYTVWRITSQPLLREHEVRDSHDQESGQSGLIYTGIFRGGAGASDAGTIPAIGHSRGHKKPQSRKVTENEQGSESCVSHMF
jgi:hypothetical protein